MSFAYFQFPPTQFVLSDKITDKHFNFNCSLPHIQNLINVPQFRNLNDKDGARRHTPPRIDPDATEEHQFLLHCLPCHCHKNPLLIKQQLPSSLCSVYDFLLFSAVVLIPSMHRRLLHHSTLLTHPFHHPPAQGCAFDYILGRQTDSDTGWR